MAILYSQKATISRVTSTALTRNFGVHSYFPVKIALGPVNKPFIDWVNGQYPFHGRQDPGHSGLSKDHVAISAYFCVLYATLLESVRDQFCQKCTSILPQNLTQTVQETWLTLMFLVVCPVFFNGASKMGWKSKYTGGFWAGAETRIAVIEATHNSFSGILKVEVHSKKRWNKKLHCYIVS